MAILELRVEGYGYKEIADKLGYKNHSGVIKRMEAIKSGSSSTRTKQGGKATQAGSGGRGFFAPKSER